MCRRYSVCLFFTASVVTAIAFGCLRTRQASCHACYNCSGSARRRCWANSFSPIVAAMASICGECELLGWNHRRYYALGVDVFARRNMHCPRNSFCRLRTAPTEWRMTNIVLGGTLPHVPSTLLPCLRAVLYFRAEIAEHFATQKQDSQF